jgi:1,2-diacylglycerol 3-beta-glucosyltransferase
MSEALVPIVIGGLVLYSAAFFFLSGRRRCNTPDSPDDLFFVIVVPCLNEELVIKGTLQRLSSLYGTDHAVLVVDDGSDDATGRIVEASSHERVWLLRRELPDARLGKGAALNAAFRYVRSFPEVRERNHDRVILCVVDADGRLESDVLRKVGSHFADPKVGAVQIGVRMSNADTSLMTRLQDFEFAIFTQIFQTARRLVGSVGLGGNGQFTRLSALESLGDTPWSDSLTEDLDLGLSLLVSGWRNDFCTSSCVKQQAVTKVGRLIRQRTRWYHGHMQSWRRLPDILGSRLSVKATADLVFYLTSPIVVLLLSPMILFFYVTVLALLIASPSDAMTMLLDRGFAIALFSYALSFGAGPFYAVAYSREEPQYGLLRSIALAHLFCLYAFVWTVAGWAFLFRIVLRRRSWAKTERSRDTEVALPRARARQEPGREEVRRGSFERFILAGVPPETASRMTVSLWKKVCEIYFASWALENESTVTSSKGPSASSV